MGPRTAARSGRVATDSGLGAGQDQEPERQHAKDIRGAVDWRSIGDEVLKSAIAKMNARGKRKEPTDAEM